MNENFIIIFAEMSIFMIFMLILGHIQEWRDSKESDSTD